jgi:(p)ppGpp synthase/HD superfamily hydrolase
VHEHYKDINKRYGNLKAIIEKIQDEIKFRLRQEGLANIKTSGRRKTTSSIYRIFTSI